jgi:hypothetical protein
VANAGRGIDQHDRDRERGVERRLERRYGDGAHVEQVADGDGAAQTVK